MVGQIGPKFGYFVNPKKTHLLVKPHLLHEAESIFQGSGIKITIRANVILGLPLERSFSLNMYMRKLKSGEKNRY